MIDSKSIYNVVSSMIYCHQIGSRYGDINTIIPECGLATDMLHLIGCAHPFLLCLM